MLTFGWWKDKENRDSVSAIVGVLKVVVPAGFVAVIALGTYLGLTPSEPAPKPAQPAISVTGTGNAVQTGDGVQVVQGDQGTVIVGMTIEQHEAILQRRITELRQDLDRATAAERQLVEAELSAISDQLTNLQSSYEEAVEDLRQLRVRLSEFEGKVAPERLAEAQEALYQGDRSLADDLFADLETDLDDEIALAAEAAYGRGQIAEAEIRWADAATHYARAAVLAPDFGRLYKAHTFAWRAGDYSASSRFGEDMLAIAKKGENQNELLLAMNAQALTLIALGHHGEAEALHMGVLEIERAILGNANPSYSTSLSNLATVLRAQGRYSEAEDLYRQALEIGLIALGETHPDYASYLANLALVVYDQGRFAEAQELFAQSLVVFEATVGDTHPAYGTALHNLALAVRAQGQYEAAEALHTQSLAISQATLGEDHPRYAIQLANLALVLTDQGRLEEAEQMLRRALKISRSTLGETHPSYALQLDKLAQVLWAQSRYTEAEASYLDALKIMEVTLPAEHPDIQTTRDNLAALRADKQ